MGGEKTTKQVIYRNCPLEEIGRALANRPILAATCHEHCALYFDGACALVSMAKSLARLARQAGNEIEITGSAERIKVRLEETYVNPDAGASPDDQHHDR